MPPRQALNTLTAKRFRGVTQPRIVAGFHGHFQNRPTGPKAFARIPCSSFERKGMLPVARRAPGRTWSRPKSLSRTQGAAARRRGDGRGAIFCHQCIDSKAFYSASAIRKRVRIAENIWGTRRSFLHVLREFGPDAGALAPGSIAAAVTATARLEQSRASRPSGDGSSADTTPARHHETACLSYNLRAFLECSHLLRSEYVYLVPMPGCRRCRPRDAAGARGRQRKVIPDTIST